MTGGRKGGGRCVRAWDGSGSRDPRRGVPRTLGPVSSPSGRKPGPSHFTPVSEPGRESDEGERRRRGRRQRGHGGEEEEVEKEEKEEEEVERRRGGGGEVTPFPYYPTDRGPPRVRTTGRDLGSSHPPPNDETATRGTNTHVPSPPPHCRTLATCRGSFIHGRGRGEQETYSGRGRYLWVSSSPGQRGGEGTTLGTPTERVGW